MARETYRIDITIEADDKYSAQLDTARKKVGQLEKSIAQNTSRSSQHMSRFQQSMNKTINRINQRLDSMTKGRWSLTLRAVDNASRVIRNVSSFAQRVTGRTYRIAVRAVDYVTRPLRSIVRSIGSILGAVGIVGGIAGGIVMPLKMTIDRQNITTAFEVLLGSQEKARKRIAELTEFASQTPYTRDEIYQASRILEVFTKGALSTGEGLRMVGDIAAGTQQDFGDVALWMGRLYDAMAAGRPVGEMTSRLQEMGAISGSARARIEKLAESGKNINKIWPEVTKEFSRYDGMMGKLSDNLANLLLGVKASFMNNVIMRWGQGIANVLEPALSKFRDWRKENSKAIEAMGDAIERYGEKFTRYFVDKFESGFSYIDELFFSDKYSDLTFDAKVRLIIDDARDAFSEWWENTGRDKVTEVGSKAGRTLGSTAREFILGALGIESKNEGGFMSAGFEAGSSFAKGFLEGFDATEVVKAIGNKILDINVKGISSAAKGEGYGGLIGAGFVDLLVLGALSSLLRPLKSAGTFGKKAWDVTKGTGSWLWNMITGKRTAKSPKGAPPTKATQQPSRTVIYDQYGRPLTTRDQTQKVDSRKFKFPKIKLPKGISSLGKRLPYIGPLIAGLSLFSATGDEIPGAMGGLSGGLAGAAVGASIGSAIPVVGTTVGGIAGGLLGAFGGEKLGSWIGSRFETGSRAIAADASVGEGAFAQFQEQASIVTQNLQSLATWTAQASNWVVGAFQPLQSVGTFVNHNINVLSTWLAQASGWIVAAFSPLPSSGEQINHNMSALASWLGQASIWVVSLQGIQSSANSVKAALNHLASRIRNVKVPTISTSNIKEYARGTNFHPGGLAIVGDGGGPELIQYPNGRLALSPSTDTLVNLPRGTKVMPHHKLTNVPTYADGIGTIDTDTIGANNGTTIVYGDTNIGDTHVTVVIEGGSFDDPEGFATVVADQVAGVIAEKIEQVASNMPVTESGD